MKKTLFGILLASILLFTGCSKKYEIECEKNSTLQNEKVDSVVENVHLVYNKSKDKIDTVTTKFIINLNELDNDTREKVKNEIDTYCSDNDKKYEECKIDITEQKIVIEATGKAEEFGLDGVDSNTKYDDAKASLEKNDFTCKSN